jgi:hypothetical protein
MSAPTAVADRILGSSARVDFRPPAYDGGLPIEGYEVTVNGPGGGTKACSSSPCTVTGLMNGKDYSFTVRSRNPVGSSDPSPASNTVRPDTKPKATSITDVTPGDRRLTVNWAEPANDGSPVLQYRVQWVDIGGNAGTGSQALVSAPAMTKVISGLVNDDAYNIRVQARNEAGWGPFGPDVKAQSFGKPAAVPAPTLSPREPVPGAANAQVSISWPSTDPNGPAITKYDVYRRTGGGAWNLIATRSGGESRVASDTIPYQGQTVQYVVTATNGGPSTSDKANYSSYVADGVPETPTLKSVSTPSKNYSANATFSLGDSRSRGYDKVNWRTTAGRSGSWSCSGGCSGGTATNLGTSQQSMDIQACNVAGRCSPWSNNVTFHPYGPTNGVPGLRETHDNNSITFTWGTAPSEGRPITGYEIDGDRNQTVGPGTHSTTFNNLGYSTSKRIRVRAIAQDSGPGPWTGYVTGTTNAAPQPKVNWLRPYGSAGYQPGCSTGQCQYLQYDLQDFQGDISCTFASDHGPWPYNYDDGTNGSIQPRNGTNTSGKFFGFSNGWVRVTCTGSNGSDSFTRDPWGG